MFDLWTGIRSIHAGRIALKSSNCGDRLHGLTDIGYSTSLLPNITFIPEKSAYPVVPSQRISRYIDQFISKELAGERYIAVMLRTEQMKKSIFTNIVPNESACVKHVMSDWNEKRESHNISRTLLFSDVGAHGSMGWRGKQPAAFKFVSYLQHAVHSDLPLNAILEKITGSKDSVVIAQLNQQLVARATCVVIAGGGSFQQQALNMYFHYHRGKECYTFRKGNCERFYISRIFGRELHS